MIAIIASIKTLIFICSLILTFCSLISCFFKRDDWSFIVIGFTIALDWCVATSMLI